MHFYYAIWLPALALLPGTVALRHLRHLRRRRPIEHPAAVRPPYVSARIPRRRKRRRSPAASPPPPPSAVTVLSATKVGAVYVDFTFSAAVTTDGAGTESVIVQMIDGPYDAVASTQVAANVVRFEFSGSALAAGDAWEILSLPACLDFHGNTFAVPQGGVVG